MRGAHIRREILPIEEVIHFEPYQNVVPKAHVVHPVGGERLLGAMSQRCQGLVGQRGAPVGQPPSPRPLVALAAELLTLLSSWDYYLSYHSMGYHLITSGT